MRAKRTKLMMLMPVFSINSPLNSVIYSMLFTWKKNSFIKKKTKTEFLDNFTENKFLVYFTLTVYSQMTEARQDFRLALISIPSILYYYHSAIKKICYACNLIGMETMRESIKMNTIEYLRRCRWDWLMFRLWIAVLSMVVLSFRALN